MSRENVNIKFFYNSVHRFHNSNACDAIFSNNSDLKNYYYIIYKETRYGSENQFYAMITPWLRYCEIGLSIGLPVKKKPF